MRERWSMRKNNIYAQKMYDWLDRNFREFDGYEFTWKYGAIGTVARFAHTWLYENFDIIPF